MTTERPRFPIGLTIAVAIAFAILVGLGTWQVQRLHWKEGLLARIAALQAAPARPLEPVLERIAQGGDADFTRVLATCAHIETAPFLELYGVRDGQAGVRLISACEVNAGGYRSILIDRGFVPDTVAARPPVVAGPQAEPIAVPPFVGVLRKADRGNLFSPANTPQAWYTRDIPAMAAALKASAPAPLFLMAETSTNPEFKALTPVPVPVDIPNNHFSYALTWYGLAAALLGVYAAMLFRRRNS
jgi:surfeit locus 1 family protein